MGQYFKYLFYTLRNKSSFYFYSISQYRAKLCFIVVFLFLKSWLIWSTNNTVWFFSEYFICHFYILWAKVMSAIFTPKIIRCSRSFSNFDRFYFWLCVTPSNATCNALIISCSSQVTMSGSNRNFFWILKIFLMIFYSF